MSRAMRSRIARACAMEMRWPMTKLHAASYGEWNSVGRMQPCCRLQAADDGVAPAHVGERAAVDVEREHRERLLPCALCSRAVARRAPSPVMVAGSGWRSTTTAEVSHPSTGNAIASAEGSGSNSGQPPKWRCWYARSNGPRGRISKVCGTAVQAYRALEHSAARATLSR